MPTSPHPRLTRALKATCLFALCAAVAVIGLPSEHAHPPERIATTTDTRVSVYPGSLTDRRAELAAGIERAEHAQLAAFYEQAAKKSATVRRPARIQREGNVGAEQMQADGDRFDRLASCESGGDPTAVSPGGRYRGAFQFSLPSWHSAGMDGDPVDYSYAEQKQTAMRWAGMTTPSSQWPVCWPRSG